MTSRIVQIASMIVFSTILLAANKVPPMEYSPYQILIWEIKANEGYRSWWYPDGYVQGRKASAIGFGWNDCGNRRRGEIKEFTRDHNVTFDEALIITLREVKKYGTLNKDPYKNLALQLYSYNCGPTKNGSKLGKCCGAKWGCGSKSKNVRKGHNRRRKFELALWNHDSSEIRRYTEENKKKLSIMLPILKAKGQL